MSERITPQVSKRFQEHRMDDRMISGLESEIVVLN